ncbi:MAG: DUF4910 domain-containing protein [candidate division Zixibacteria bacterium]|nr:DUF4910 domain-containing protein [candidate division Zixibacteria bacterium]
MFVCLRTDAQIVDPSLFGLVGSRIDEQRAFQDVAYFTRFWRTAGTPDFDRCMDYTLDHLEKSGFSDQDSFFQYRIDKEPLATPVWIPTGASLHLRRPERRMLHEFSETPVLQSRNSFPVSTVAEVVYVEEGTEDRHYTGKDVRGKLVLGLAPPGPLYREAVTERGALGILSAYIEDYNRPDLFPDAVRDGEIPYDPERRSFGMMVSQRTLDLLRGYVAAGKTIEVAVETQSEFTFGVRRTLSAEIRGASRPNERIVLVGHLDHYQPGANDNASGAATLLEIARATATLIREGRLPPPARTLTFLWVDEYAGTTLWMDQHPDKVQSVVAALVLDMVGERTALTGGPFRVERMPDPAAIWTRPPDEHTTWGAQKVNHQMIRGHFLNDFYLALCRQYAATTGWIVAENPWEGGSDHDLFLDRGIPAVLKWHFPDYFYHTHLDALDKVDPDELKRVGTVAMTAALTLASGTEVVARRLIDVVLASAEKRFADEMRNSQEALRSTPPGPKRLTQETEERSILMAWAKWYEETLDSINGFPVGETGDGLVVRLERAKQQVGKRFVTVLGVLGRE